MKKLIALCIYCLLTGACFSSDPKSRDALIERAKFFYRNIERRNADNLWNMAGRDIRSSNSQIEYTGKLVEFFQNARISTIGSRLVVTEFSFPIAVTQASIYVAVYRPKWKPVENICEKTLWRYYEESGAWYFEKSNLLCDYKISDEDKNRYGR